MAPVFSQVVNLGFLPRPSVGFYIIRKDSMKDWVDPTHTWSEQAGTMFQVEYLTYQSLNAQQTRASLAACCKDEEADSFTISSQISGGKDSKLIVAL